MTVGFSCTQCGETLDWDQFFGVKQNDEPSNPGGQAGSPGQMRPPSPVSSRKVWWMSLNWLGKLLWISIFIILISLGIMGIGWLTNARFIVDTGYAFIAYGVIGLVIFCLVVGMKMYADRPS